MTKNITSQFEQHLRRQNLRLTDQRRIIVDAFANQEGHLSAEELYRLVQEKYPSMGFATVYRTLKLLAEAGIAAGKDFGDGFVRFECCHKSRSGHHDHLICTVCGKIVEFVNPLIEEMQETVAGEHGFKIHNHSLDIYGTCKKCS